MSMSKPSGEVVIAMSSGAVAASLGNVNAAIPFAFDGVKWQIVTSEKSLAIRLPAVLAANVQAVVQAIAGGTQALVFAVSVGCIDGGPVSIMLGSDRIFQCGVNGGNQDFSGGYLGADGDDVIIRNEGPVNCTELGCTIHYILI